LGAVPTPYGECGCAPLTSYLVRAANSSPTVLPSSQLGGTVTNTGYERRPNPISQIWFQSKKDATGGARSLLRVPRSHRSPKGSRHRAPHQRRLHRPGYLWKYGPLGYPKATLPVGRVEALQPLCRRKTARRRIDYSLFRKERIEGGRDM
jgi:hypothetical protein